MEDGSINYCIDDNEVLSVYLEGKLLFQEPNVHSDEEARQIIEEELADRGFDE